MSAAPGKKVEVLYVAGCPHHRATLDRVRDVARELGVPADVTAVEVRTLEDAERRRFLGSPSVQVDGVDVEPAARASAAYGVACRTYAGAGVPPREMLRAALSRTPTGTEEHARAPGGGRRRSPPTAAAAAALLLPVCARCASQQARAATP